MTNGVDARPAGNARAGWSVVVGLLSVVTLPVAVAATRWSARYDLLHAGLAIPLGAGLGIGATGAGAGGASPSRAHARPRRRVACGLVGQGARDRRPLRRGAAAIAVGVYELLRYLETT